MASFSGLCTRSSLEFERTLTARCERGNEAKCLGRNFLVVEATQFHQQKMRLLAVALFFAAFTAVIAYPYPFTMNKVTPLNFPQDVECPNGGYCESYETCCKNGPTSYGCCPYSYATCCSDEKHCCRAGYTCSYSSCYLDKRAEQISRSLRDQPPEIVVCPDGQSECPDGNTCCALTSDQWGCCPLPNAVCCSDGQHCCPQGYTCDTSAGTCTQQNLPVTSFLSKIRRTDDRVL